MRSKLSEEFALFVRSIPDEYELSFGGDGDNGEYILDLLDRFVAQLPQDKLEGLLKSKGDNMDTVSNG